MSSTYKFFGPNTAANKRRPTETRYITDTRVAFSRAPSSFAP